MADALGRHGVTVDLSADYSRLEGHRPVVGLPQRSHPALFGNLA